MSSIFNTLNYQVVGAVTQAQLAAGLNQRVSKNQLTTTGTFGGVLQLTSAGATSLSRLNLIGTNYPHIMANSSNRIIFNDVAGGVNDTGTVVTFGSASSSRNMLLGFTKTGVKTAWLGMDGSNVILGPESTGGLVVKTGLSFNSTNILGSGSTIFSVDQTGLASTSAAGSVAAGTGGISTTGGIVSGGIVQVGTLLTFFTGNTWTQGSSPSQYSFTNIGTSPTVNVQGGDQCGSISITPAATPATGTIFTITFKAGFVASAYVALSPVGANAKGSSVYVQSNNNPTGFTLGTSVALTAGQNYQWNYIVMGV